MTVANDRGTVPDAPLIVRAGSVSVTVSVRTRTGAAGGRGLGTEAPVGGVLVGDREVTVRCAAMTEGPAACRLVPEPTSNVRASTVTAAHARPIPAASRKRINPWVRDALTGGEGYRRRPRHRSSAPPLSRIRVAGFEKEYPGFRRIVRRRA